jgi:membrane protein
VVDKKSIGLTLKMRLRELVIIFSAGILFLIGIFLEAGQVIAVSNIENESGIIRLFFNNSINFIISLIIVTAWFGLIFCFLPDGRVPMRIGFTGAFITAILFSIGKWLLKWGLLYSDLNSIFGKSGSVVLLLLFVFYSALIFYLGGALTKVLVIKKGEKIRPLPHARNYGRKPHAQE